MKHHRSLIVVMIDDNPEDRFLVKRLLRRTSAKLIEIPDAGAGLLARLRGVYSAASTDELSSVVILLDLDLPQRHGSHVLAEIKADSTLRGLPVVVLTATVNPTDINRMYELGAASYIEKRGTPAEMTAKLEAFVAYWTLAARTPNRPPGPPISEARALRELAHRLGWNQPVLRSPLAIPLIVSSDTRPSSSGGSSAPRSRRRSSTWT